MKIVCYGDSNTYGYDGDEMFGGRFPEGRRWPDLLGQMLGCETVNCGLNGRRVPRFRRSTEADAALLQRWSVTSQEWLHKLITSLMLSMTGTVPQG